MIFSYIGGRNANSARQHQADVANAFSERMASTQYQRATADLRAAGLNPILAATKGMSSAAPAGQQANISDVASPAVSSGHQTYSAIEHGKSQAQNRQIKEPLAILAETLAPLVAQGAKALADLPATIREVIQATQGKPVLPSVPGLPSPSSLLSIPGKSLEFFGSLPGAAAKGVGKAAEAAATTGKTLFQSIKNPTPEEHKIFIPPAEWGYHPSLGKNIRKNYRKGISIDKIIDYKNP